MENITSLLCILALNWFLLQIQSITSFTIHSSFMAHEKVNSSGSLPFCGYHIFTGYLIKYYGPDVTAAGMSIMVLHSIRHGQTIKVPVIRLHMLHSVPASISPNRHIFWAPAAMFTSPLTLPQQAALPCIQRLHICTDKSDSCLPLKCNARPKIWFQAFGTQYMCD